MVPNKHTHTHTHLHFAAGAFGYSVRRCRHRRPRSVVRGGSGVGNIIHSLFRPTHKRELGSLRVGSPWVRRDEDEWTVRLRRRVKLWVSGVRRGDGGGGKGKVKVGKRAEDCKRLVIHKVVDTPTCTVTLRYAQCQKSLPFERWYRMNLPGVVPPPHR